MIRPNNQVLRIGPVSKTHEPSWPGMGDKSNGTKPFLPAQVTRIMETNGGVSNASPDLSALGVRCNTDIFLQIVYDSNNRNCSVPFRVQHTQKHLFSLLHFTATFFPTDTTCFHLGMQGVEVGSKALGVGVSGSCKGRNFLTEVSWLSPFQPLFRDQEKKIISVFKDVRGVLACEEAVVDSWLNSASVGSTQKWENHSLIWPELLFWTLLSVLSLYRDNLSFNIWSLRDPNLSHSSCS